MKRCASGHVYTNAEWNCPDCGDGPVRLDGYLAFAPELARKNDGFAAEYFPKVATFEEGNFWFESRNRLLLWAVGRYFPQLQVSGSEMFVDALPYAASRLPGTTLFQMDARRIPFESEFDLIGGFDVLEHIEEDNAVLREMHRALQPGGGLILTVPQHPFLWSVIDDYSFHKRRYTRSELIGKVRAAGFEILTVTSFISILLPFMFLSRLRRRSAARDFDPHAEFKIGAGVNRILTQALTLERLAIQQGASLPMGGSLLLVAQRVAIGGQSLPGRRS